MRRLQPHADRLPPPTPPSRREAFDLAKVNLIRERIRRGTYQVDAAEVAECLLAEHLLLSLLLDG